MGYVKIKVLEESTADDLRRWEDHMMEKPKCWNKFCFACYKKENLKAVHVKKIDNDTNSYITSLCEDCIKDISKNDILVNDCHLMVERHLLPIEK